MLPRPPLTTSSNATSTAAGSSGTGEAFPAPDHVCVFVGGSGGSDPHEQLDIPESISCGLSIRPCPALPRQIQRVHGRGTDPIGDKAGTHRVASGCCRSRAWDWLGKEGENFQMDDFNAHFLPILAWSRNIQSPRLGARYFIIPNVKTVTSCW